MTTWNKPLPIPDETTAPFWDAARQHRLVFQRCQDCRAFHHPPVSFCPDCHNLDTPTFAFEEVSGRGRIVNWTVMNDPMVTGFGQEPPWVNVLVEMEEQKRLLFVATLEDGPQAPLTIGAAVVTIFKDVTPEVSIPYFKLGK